VQQAGCDTTHQIEDQVAAAAQAILDVIAENVQRQHVAEQMRPPGVQKHRGQ
jgi:hypothetical protein